MNLTEPQAGSDLGAAAHRAPSPQATAPTASSAQKIFITYGDHDLADNIIHLVLARLPDAPAGTRGHLAVPRAQVPGRRRTVRSGERNDVRCVALEHKLGIHASPTCA